MTRKPLYVSTLYREKWGSLGWLICFPISALKYELCVLVSSQGHNFFKLKYISLEEVKIVPFQQ